MSETLASTLEHLRTVVGDQVVGYRRLLESTREANQALRTHDVETFDRLLAEQVETLRELKGLQRERSRVLREVGDPGLAEGVRELETDLRGLAHEVSRATRVTGLVIERNGALVAARIGLHRRAGHEAQPSTAGVNRIA